MRQVERERESVSEGGRERKLCVAPHAAQFLEVCRRRSSCSAGRKEKITGRRQKQWSVQISDRNLISESEGDKKKGRGEKKVGHKKISETH